MIYLTGDTHGDRDIRKLSSNEFLEGKDLTKDDYVVICGDFGLIWANEPDSHEKHWLKWLNEKPWTTLVIRGNHENHSRLNKLPEKEMFGDKVKIISDTIFLLETGKVYIIENHKILVVGGGLSIDKSRRVEGISWWPEELLSKDQENQILDVLDKHQWEVDMIWSHTGPNEILGKIFPFIKKQRRNPYLTQKYWDPVAVFLQHLLDQGLSFDVWYFGHFHEDRCHGKLYRALFNNIAKIVIDKEGKICLESDL